MSAKPVSICLVAHNAYGVLAGVDTGHMGGIEVQTPLTARWLAAKGHEVSMITWDESPEHAHEEGHVIDGVRVHKICRRDDGLPIMRFLHPRWSSLHAALTRANPDIVYYNCGDLGLGQVVFWANRHRRKVLYSVANDVDCERELPVLKPMRERVLYRYGLRHVDRIVAQTEKQKRLLASDFQRESTVIPMPSRGFNIDGPFERRGPAEGEPTRILWVGRLSGQKRLEWLLDLAEICPDVMFDVLGAANTDSEYARRLVNRARGISNVVLHGRVAHHDMGRFYSNAHLLCCTSVFEGFPNVFLEAWSVGIPLITTFDPDNVVARFGHGVVARDVTGLKHAINDLTMPDRWRKASVAARSYFSRFHQVDSSMERLETEILNLVQQ